MRMLLYITMLFLSFSCSETEAKKKEVQTEKVKPVMYQISEMAGMMEGVYVFNKVLRDSIQKGAALPEFLDGLEYLHKAQATSPKEIDSNFHDLLDQYLSEIEKIKTSDRQKKIEAFNASIKICVDCHQTRCQGPIPKIKRLRIPSE